MGMAPELESKREASVKRQAQTNQVARGSIRKVLLVPNEVKVE